MPLWPVPAMHIYEGPLLQSAIWNSLTVLADVIRYSRGWTTPSQLCLTTDCLKQELAARQTIAGVGWLPYQRLLAE